MTYSIIALDEETGAFGGATATGTPVVGGFVLHAMEGVGVVATQGLYTSPLYGRRALDRAARGRRTAREIVASLVAEDDGRVARQVAVMTAGGDCGVYTGADNLPECCTELRPGVCVVANWVGSADVGARIADAFEAARGPVAERLLAALAAGAAAGGDARGDRSAALVVADPNAPPVDLRADDEPDPIAKLRRTWAATREPAFQAFLAGVPVLNDPYRRGAQAGLISGSGAPTLPRPPRARSRSRPGAGSRPSARASRASPPRRRRPAARRARGPRRAPRA